MSYATVQDMITRFTEAELIQLAPLTPRVAPFYDEARVEQVLADASAEMDSYLATRFTTPITDVLPLLVQKCCDLAREGLDRTGRAHVLEAGKRARAWLKDIAQGKATLGSAPEGDPDGVPQADGGGVQVRAADPVFTPELLAGYLR